MTISVDDLSVPNGQPKQLANLRPWKVGGPTESTRRSKHVEETLKLARKHSTEALLYGISVLRDTSESTRYRLMAMQTILDLAMPKDPAALERMLAEMAGGGERVFRIEFVKPGEGAPIVIDAEPPAKPNGHANGHDPVKPVFVKPDEQDGP